MSAKIIRFVPRGHEVDTSPADASSTDLGASVVPIHVRDTEDFIRRLVRGEGPRLLMARHNNFSPRTPKRGILTFPEIYRTEPPSTTNPTDAALHAYHTIREFLDASFNVAPSDIWTWLSSDTTIAGTRRVARDVAEWIAVPQRRAIFADLDAADRVHYHKVDADEHIRQAMFKIDTTRKRLGRLEDLNLALSRLTQSVRVNPMVVVGVNADQFILKVDALILYIRQCIFVCRRILTAASVQLGHQCESSGTKDLESWPTKGQLGFACHDAYAREKNFFASVLPAAALALTDAFNLPQAQGHLGRARQRVAAARQIASRYAHDLSELDYARTLLPRGFKAHWLRMIDAMASASQRIGIATHELETATAGFFGPLPLTASLNPFDLSHVEGIIEFVVWMSRQLASQLDVDLDVNFLLPEQVAVPMAARTDLARTLHALLDNAIKYGRSGGKKLVAIDAYIRDLGELIVEISDGGNTVTQKDMEEVRVLPGARLHRRVASGFGEDISVILYSILERREWRLAYKQATETDKRKALTGITAEVQIPLDTLKQATDETFDMGGESDDTTTINPGFLEGALLMFPTIML